METFYKQNIGLTTPQGDKLDYFQIDLIGFENSLVKTGAKVRFYYRKSDATAGKIPHASRTVLWDQGSDVIPEMQIEMFSLESVYTTAGEVISFNGSKLI